MSTLQVLDFTVYHNNRLYKLTLAPYLYPAKDGMPLCFDTSLNGKNIGDVFYGENSWQNDRIEDKELLKRIGSFIYSNYNGSQKLLEFPTVEE
jgi:hypothetical protein